MTGVSYQWYRKKFFKDENDTTSDRPKYGDQINGFAVSISEYYEAETDKNGNEITSSTYSAPTYQGYVSEEYGCRLEYKLEGQTIAEFFSFDIDIVSEGTGTLADPIRTYPNSGEKDILLGEALDEKAVTDNGKGLYTEDGKTLLCYQVITSSRKGWKSVEEWTPAIWAQADRNITDMELYKKSDLQFILDDNNKDLSDRDKSKDVIKDIPLYKVDNNYFAHGYTSTAKQFDMEELADDEYIVIVTVTKWHEDDESDGHEFRLTVFDGGPCAMYGHAYDEGTVSKNPETGDDAIKHTCLLCGEKYYDDIVEVNDINDAIDRLKDGAGNSNNIKSSVANYINEGNLEKIKSQITGTSTIDATNELTGKNKEELTNIQIFGSELNETSEESKMNLLVTDSSNDDAVKEIVKTELSVSTDKDKMYALTMNLEEKTESSEEQSKLQGVGDPDENTGLKVPVIVSFDIPDNIDPDKLVVVHKSEGEVTNDNELVKPIISADKKTASIVLTHFSDFVIAESTSANNSTTAVTNKSTKISGIKTGDTAELLVWLYLAFAVAALGGVIIYRRRASK